MERYRKSDSGLSPENMDADLQPFLQLLVHDRDLGPRSKTTVRNSNNNDSNLFCDANIQWSRGSIFQMIAILLILAAPISESCSTRPSPKARPPRPYWVTNADQLNQPRRNCSTEYASLYCLHNGTCQMELGFDGSTVPFCICSAGFYGRRCEYEDFIEKFLPNVQQQQIQTAAISAGVTVLIICACFATIAVYLYRRQKRFMESQELQQSQNSRYGPSTDRSDGLAHSCYHAVRPFGPRPTRNVAPSEPPLGGTIRKVEEGGRVVLQSTF